MADKSIPQLTAKTSTTSGDLYHLVRSNIDYKIDYDDLAESIRGGATATTIFSTYVDLTTAQILALFTTPITIVAAPAAGYYIEVIACSARIVYNSIAYNTNIDLDIYTATATSNQYTISSVLNATATKNVKGSEAGSAGATATQLIAAQALMVANRTANPIAGNSDVRVYVTYKIVEQ